MFQVGRIRHFLKICSFGREGLVPTSAVTPGICLETAWVSGTACMKTCPNPRVLTWVMDLMQLSAIARYWNVFEQCRKHAPSGRNIMVIICHTVLYLGSGLVGHGKVHCLISPLWASGSKGLIAPHWGGHHVIYPFITQLIRFSRSITTRFLCGSCMVILCCQPQWWGVGDVLIKIFTFDSLVCEYRELVECKYSIMLPAAFSYNPGQK